LHKLLKPTLIDQYKQSWNAQLHSQIED
jgi:hypothetical protein